MGSELIKNTDECPTYVQCDSGQVGWPNGTRLVYKESAGNASKTISNKTDR
jgi:hypothetical protein